MRRTWFLQSGIVTLSVIWLTAGALCEGAMAYESGPIENGASVVGVVRFSGTVPEPQRYKVTMGANPEFCKPIADAKGEVAVPQARVSAAGELADVVVFLQEVDKGKPMPAEGPHVVIEQCRFGTRVMTGMVGQTLRVGTRDSILHQVRGWEMVGKNRLPAFLSSALTPGGEQSVPLQIKRSSILQLSCDQHRFMESWILVTTNPYAVVTDAAGRFSLTDVPPGSHTIGAWHPVFGYQEGKVNLKPGHQTNVTLTLTPPPQ